MPVEKTLIIKQGQKGLSLIELMVSIGLGLLILVAATSMTVKSLVMNTDTLASAKLNQDIDSVTQVMVNEIRRAGFTGLTTGAGAPFRYADNEDLNIVSNTCVLYAYNANEDGVKDPTEKFGFRLTGSEVEMRTTCTDGDTCATDCTKGTWVALTDDAVTTITTLNFHSSNSKCISITDTNWVAAGNTNNYWVTDFDLTATQFPCMATSGTGLETFVLDASNDYVSGTFVAPQLDDRLIGSRLVNVEITGSLTNDNTVTKTQRVDINVRNDRIRCVGFTCP